MNRVSQIMVDENNTNLFEHFNINSSQNNRILIVGSSGSGKTNYAFRLDCTGA